MLVPVEWLKDYTDINVDTDEFCDRMIMSGSNLESVEYFGKGIEKVVVGRIEKVEKHPNADKLSVCQVDIGEDELLQIVCGADNIYEGTLVPVALHKSRIPGPIHGASKQDGGVKITKGKLRGVESFGMICSLGELGYDDKVVPVFIKDGIWLLPDDVKPGTDIVDAMGLDQPVLNFEITPNRPDCLAMLGMAREAAATFGTNLKYPDTKCLDESDEKAEDYISVEIKNPDLCRRYAARIVTDVKIAQSPWWLQKRLMYSGMRPINNIVDITNFVMLEYGQPMHAFDVRKIEGEKIIIETAKKGEKFVTLDDAERTLSEDMLLIKDGRKAIAVAGVMGGLNSEIEEDTTTIVVESANFDGDSVRTTSKKLGLRTEASSRFEKGIDPNLCKDAADRFCRLVEKLGAGKVVQATVDVYPKEEKAITTDARVDRVNAVLGIDISREDMEKMLTSLEMRVEGSGNIIKVTPPTVRMDLIDEVDYIEEVARMYGYDKMPALLPAGSNAAAKPRRWIMKEMARNAMCAMGADEVQTYSFMNPKGIDEINIAEGGNERNFVKILNPLGEETSVMRTLLTPNMLEVLSRNYSRNIEEVKVFEIGNTFFADLNNYKGLPKEQDAMSIGLYGGDADFFMLKGMIEELFKVLGLKDIEFVEESEYGTYHPGRCARIRKEGADCLYLGIMGEVHPDVSEKYGIGTRVYTAELMFDLIVELADIEKIYRPLPKYPSTSRDIALIVSEGILAGQMESIIRDKGGRILESVQLFDVYRGEQVEQGKKSVAFKLTYRDPDKTLTDKEVAQVHDKVLQALEEKLSAVLREI